MGLSKLEGLGISSVVLSTETNPVVQMRCEKLKIPCVQGCRDKGAALDRFLKEMDLSPDQVAYLGNDINDLPCLDRVWRKVHLLQEPIPGPPGGGFETAP